MVMLKNCLLKIIPSMPIQFLSDLEMFLEHEKLYNKPREFSRKVVDSCVLSSAKLSTQFLENFTDNTLSL